MQPNNREKRQIPNWHNSYFIIIGLVAATVLFQMQLDNKESEVLSIKIEEDVFFDPFCIGDQPLEGYTNMDIKPICKFSDIGGIQLGSSYNVDDRGVDYQNHIRALFLKVLVKDLPKPDIINEVTIKDARLFLMTKYDEANYTNPEGDFLIFSGLCEYTNWTEHTLSDGLMPCIKKESKNPNTTLKRFSEPFDANLITQVNIDIKSHVNYVLNNNLDSFTEIIEFYPIQFLVLTEFDDKQRNCLVGTRINNLALFEQCIKKNVIYAYSSENGSEEVRPYIIIEYDRKPSAPAQALSIGMFAFVPVIITLILDRNLRNGRQTHD